MIGSPRERGTGRCGVTRRLDGGLALTGIGAGLPVDGGRGRTWDGRPPRRIDIGLHCRTPHPLPSGGPDAPSGVSPV